MRKMALPENIVKVLKKINDSGFESYVVGGSVRDVLLNKTPHDYDVTTNATPNEIHNIFRENKIINNNGEKHGTVSVLMGEVIEITTFRNDGDYLDGRHPSTVSFTRNLKDDLSRRDLTINAMAYDFENDRIIDFFGGQEDLSNKVIRTVGAPLERFSEDYLRILRAIRFASQLGFDIETETDKAIHNLKNKIVTISAERIRSEFDKILLSKKPSVCLRKYRDVIGVFIPEVTATFDFDQKNKYHKHDVYEHTLAVVDATKQLLHIRLSAFFHDIGKPVSYSEELVDDKICGHFFGHSVVSAEIATKVLKNLKYSTNLSDAVIFLVEKHDMELVETKKCVKRIMNKIPVIDGYNSLFEDFLNLRMADRLDHINIGKTISLDMIKNLYRQIKDENECFTLKELAVNGNDVMSLGFKGREIGQVLNDVLNKVIDGLLQNNKTDIMVFLKENHYTVKGD